MPCYTQTWYVQKAFWAYAMRTRIGLVERRCVQGLVQLRVGAGCGSEGLGFILYLGFFFCLFFMRKTYACAYKLWFSRFQVVQWSLGTDCGSEGLGLMRRAYMRLRTRTTHLRARVCMWYCLGFSLAAQYVHALHTYSLSTLCACVRACVAGGGGGGVPRYFFFLTHVRALCVHVYARKEKQSDFKRRSDGLRRCRVQDFGFRVFILKN